MSQSRQLAVIIFTDIVGFTAIMGIDEQKAFSIIKKNRELQKPIIEKFNGRWIKELGDGVMASFTTVSDAVNAAIKIQEDCNASKDFQLRIGVHQGEVVFEDNDVFGDAVNIASRLQAIAIPGGIYVSESVHDNVSNKQGIETKFVKEEILKNVKDPIRIYEVYFKKEAENRSSFIEKIPAKNITDKSIAVLPFVNMSNDPEQEYFSDGIAEEILNSLTHLKDLKVAGRTSSFQFKGKNIDLREVGNKLGVSTVLEGSVRKHGNRLRITAQLIKVEDGFHLWSERYDRNLDDIFAIQDEIALAITEKLKITLYEKDIELITKLSTQNAEAYELYLKGRFHINRRGSSILTGLELFKQAIAIDPGYALAYAGLADASIFSIGYSFLPGKVVLGEVKHAAETAVQLDDSLSEAYCSLATYYLMEWKWMEAKKHYIKAIDLNPRNAQAHSLFGMLYLAFIEGNFIEAAKQGQIAIKLEPLSAIDHADLAWTLLTAKQFENSLMYAKAGIELDANSFLSYRIAGLSYIALNRFEEAIDTFKYLIKISNRHQHAVNGLIWAYCNNKNFDEAKRYLNELEQRSEQEYIAATQFALSAAWLGDVDTAFKYLEKAYSERDLVLDIKYAPYVPEILRNDTRFQILLDKIGFPK